MKKVIKKWYQLLRFPESWEADFDTLLEQKNVVPCTIDKYKFGQDPQRDLIMYLYFCEELKNTYAQRNIPDDVLYDTLSDLLIWAEVYYEVNGRIGLSEPDWVYRHLSGRLFKLGRLQFCMADGELEVHIPAVGPLLPTECQQSIQRSKNFFKTYFPDFQYDKYTCHSWLLDDTLLKFISKESNIALFADLFKVNHKEQSDAALKYIFRWDTRRENLASFAPKTGFAAKIKEYVLGGGVLYEASGMFPLKNDL